MRKNLLKIASFAVVLVVTTVGAAHAVVVPSALTAVEGDGNNTLPFDLAHLLLTSLRYQQVYDASEFSGPVLITGINFRPDAEFGAPFASVLPNVQINLSTTPRAVDGLDPTFANNVGADDTVVHAGPLALSSAFVGPGAGPKAFDITIPLTTSFLYNPGSGNLLLDVRNFGGGSTTHFDAAGGALGVAADTTSRVFSLSVADASGDVDSIGLVTRFEVQAVAAIPEPMSLALFATGLAGLALRRRRASS